MYAYEVCYKENGLHKLKGFKREEQLNKFIAKMMKKSNVKLIESYDNIRGIKVKY